MADGGSAAHNAELTRELLEAVGERRLSFWAKNLDRDVELDTRDLPQPEISGVYRGLEEFGQWTRAWLSAWEHLENELIWVDAVGDRAVVWIRMRMSGKGSRIPVEQTGGWGFTFRNGKLVHAHTFTEERKARRYLEEGGRSHPAYGSTHARRRVIEAAYHYQRYAANGEKIQRRQEGQPAHIINIAWRAQRRLNARWWQLKHQRRKPNGIVAVAIARELAGFCWEIALAD